MEPDQSEDLSARLRSLMLDLQERVYRLKLFDKKEEVNAYCDELEAQVILRVESIVRKANEAQNKLLDEISDYRARLLEPEPSLDVEPDELKHKLANLSAEIDAFNAKCSAFFEQETVDQKLFKSCSDEAEELATIARSIRRRMREQTFQSDFLKFDCGQENILDEDLVGMLWECGQDIEDELPAFYNELGFCEPKVYLVKQEENEFGYKQVVGVIFLADGNLAVLLDEGPIVIWSTTTRQTLFSLASATLAGNSEPEKIEANSMVQLANGMIASSDFDGNIDLWNLQTRKHVKRLYLGKAIVDLHKALPNGNVVAQINNLAVVNPDLDSHECVLFVLPSSGGGSFECIDLLESDQLAAVDRKCQFKVWNLETRQLVKSGRFAPIGRTILTWKILSNGDALASLEDGSFEFFSMLNGKRSRMIKNDTQYGVVQEPDGSVLFFDRGEKTLKLGNKEYLVGVSEDPFVMSPNGKYMASGCGEGALVLWTMTEPIMSFP